MSQLRTLIRKLQKALIHHPDDLFDLFDQLLLEDRAYYNEFLLFQGRYSRLEARRQKGVLSAKDHEASLNELSEQLISFINRLTLDDIRSDKRDAQAPEEPTSAPPPKVIPSQKNTINNSTIHVGRDLNMGDKSIN